MRNAVHGRGPADVGLVGGDVDTHLARGDQQEPQRDGEQLALDHDQDDDDHDDVEAHLARGDQQESQRNGEQLLLDLDDDDDVEAHCARGGALERC